MANYFYVALGGALGAALRYFLSQSINTPSSGFPLPTFLINICACFLMGMFLALTDKFQGMDTKMVLFLTTGLCGGFSTFSAFSAENWALFEQGQYWLSAFYSLGSIVLCFCSFILGRYVLTLFMR